MPIWRVMGWSCPYEGPARLPAPSFVIVVMRGVLGWAFRRVVCGRREGAGWICEGIEGERNPVQD